VSLVAVVAAILAMVVLVVVVVVEWEQYPAFLSLLSLIRSLLVVVVRLGLRVPGRVSVRWFHVLVVAEVQMLLHQVVMVVLVAAVAVSLILVEVAKALRVMGHIYKA
jgi:hypothetical protein